MRGGDGGGGEEGGAYFRRAPNGGSTYGDILPTPMPLTAMEFPTAETVPIASAPYAQSFSSNQRGDRSSTHGVNISAR